MCCDISFGHVAILLYGDPGQLPLVMGELLWKEFSVMDDDMNGFQNISNLIQ